MLTNAAVVTLLVLAACTSHAAPPGAANTSSMATVPPPDLLNQAVTQATIATTVCKRGWSTSQRPPQAYTETLKRLQIRNYGYADRRLSSYEEDHVEAIELGGAPAAKANLFPEPHSVSVPDDGLEASLHSRVCKGSLSLADAQAQLFGAKLSHGYDRIRSLA